MKVVLRERFEEFKPKFVDSSKHSWRMNVIVPKYSKQIEGRVVRGPKRGILTQVLDCYLILLEYASIWGAKI